MGGGVATHTHTEYWGEITTSQLTAYHQHEKLYCSGLKLLNRNKLDLAIDRNVIAIPKEVLQMQSADVIAIAFTAIACIQQTY